MANKLTSGLSRDIAAQILDRAATIDAAERHDLTTLRSAAADAGISPESFDRALAEMVAGAPREARPTKVERANLYEVALKSALIGVMSGIVSFAVASFMLGSPSEDAVAGAVIGGGGALAGVLTYLLHRASK